MSDASPFAGLPPAFIESNGADPGWLHGLPEMVQRFAARWSLVLAPPFAGITLNYVAPAVRADGTPAVFKLSRHVAETRNEIAALRLWDGAGAARLLAADEAEGALLLERLQPGTMLAEVAAADDDTATAIAASVLRRLWRTPTTTDHGLRPLASWCAAYDRNRAALSSGAHGFPARLFRRADELRAELLATTDTVTVLHGDMHHFNVLRAERSPWLAIDPKGLLGDRHFDVCQFLRNPRIMPPEANTRRLAIFADELALNRRRLREWCLVHAVLDACWEYEDGRDWRQKVDLAEATLRY